MKKWLKNSTKKKSLLWKLLVINGEITLALLILCSALFLISINRIMARYVNYDIDFFLTQMADNLETKVSYMESTVLAIRRNDQIMAYLNGDEGADAEEFGRTVNISSEANMGEEAGPLVETVFLFKNEEEILSTCYYALTEADSRGREEQAGRAYRVFQALQREDAGVSADFYREENKGFLSYTVFDEAMNPKGTAVFEMNMQTVLKSMKEVNNYSGAFWILGTASKVYQSQGGDVVDTYMEAGSRDALREPHNRKIAGQEYRVYEKELSLGMKAVIGIPRNQIRPILMDSAFIYLLGIIIIAVLAGVAYVFYSIRVTKPLTELTEGIDHVKEGDFETKLPEYDSREFNEIGTVFNEMTEYINHLIRDGYEKQLALQQLDLKFMQSQMNPHFMFNVLNTIALQAKMDGNEEVFKMISSFSKLIQAKIYREDREKVRIREELEYVEYYLYLQHYRYGNSLEYEILLEKEEAAEYFIPKLCIQILVENAVTHGLEPKTGKGKVEVGVYKENEQIIIEIRDNGVGFDGEESGVINLSIIDGEKPDESHNRIGLNNMNHIIKLMYGENYGIKIFSSYGEGCTVRVILPVDRGGQ